MLGKCIQLGRSELLDFLILMNHINLEMSVIFLKVAVFLFEVCILSIIGLALGFIFGFSRMFLNKLPVDFAALEVFFHLLELSGANLSVGLLFCPLSGFQLLLSVADSWLRRLTGQFILDLLKIRSSTIKSLFGCFELFLGL